MNRFQRHRSWCDNSLKVLYFQLALLETNTNKETSIADPKSIHFSDICQLITALITPGAHYVCAPSMVESKLDYMTKHEMSDRSGVIMGRGNHNAQARQFDDRGD